MACLALSLQPTNGPDILLQTREWFPPPRALAALASFRLIRLSLSSSSSSSPSSSGQTKPSSSSSIPPALTEDLDSSIGDDPLAASGGQVIVGFESKYRIVYRLVNVIYVLGITTVDRSSDGGSPINNVFDCINTVNQAVNVVVAACRGVDVTPEKLHRKYPEIYMALDIVLRGVGSVRLAAILSSIHGDSIAKMVQTGIESENRVRGADMWSGPAEALALESFSSVSFELPQETLAAGDEVAAAIAPFAAEEQPKEAAAGDEPVEEKDPFAASDAVNKPEEALMGGFKKAPKSAMSSADPAAALSGLEVTALPPAEATKSTFIGVEGFEGEYGGIEFGNEEVSLSEAFEGFDNAFGGGLDASEFVAAKKAAPKSQGLGGLELLGVSQAPPPTQTPREGTPLENLLVDGKREMTVPEMNIVEEISAEFRESLLTRVGFKGTIFLRTIPPKQSAGKETEFSFRIEGTSRIKRAVILSSCTNSLGNGMFHVRTQSKEEPIPVMKFSLLPRLTPLPLRLRLIKRHSGTLLSVMIQYASNPALPEPLSNVKFILKLPVDPTLLKVSPKALLSRSEKELTWHIPDIPLMGPAGRLRARMPVDQDSYEGEVEVHALVKFSSRGTKVLSEVCLRPVADGITQFNEVSHTYESGSYMCN